MEKKTKNEEKIVYKFNTKALMWFILIVISALFVVFLSIPIKNWIRVSYLKSWEWHEVPKYNIEFKLPRAFKDLELKTQSSSQLSSSIFTTDTDVKVNEEYVSQKPEVVYYGGNILNGISMMIQCLNTEKTTRSLDDIADSQHVLVTIFYEDDYNIGEATKEYVTVLSSDAIRTSTDLTNSEEVRTMINYLVPTDDKEVTITFFGRKNDIESAEKDIEKIITNLKEIEK